MCNLEMTLCLLSYTVVQIVKVRLATLTTGSYTYALYILVERIIYRIRHWKEDEIFRIEENLSETIKCNI